MKTAKRAIAIFLILFGTVKFNAQHIVPFVNNLNCDVTAGFEEWYINSGGVCVSACQAGNFVIAPGGTFNYTTCNTPSAELCVWVIDIGGTAVNSGGCSNHASMNTCDQNPSIGQTGSCGAAACLPGGVYNLNYSITPSGGQWSIN